MNPNLIWRTQIRSQRKNRFSYFDCSACKSNINSFLLSHWSFSTGYSREVNMPSSQDSVHSDAGRWATPCKRALKEVALRFQMSQFIRDAQVGDPHFGTPSESVEMLMSLGLKVEERNQFILRQPRERRDDNVKEVWRALAWIS